MMRTKLTISITMLAVIICGSCRRSVTGEKLLAYITDPSHGLVQQKQVKSRNIMVQYLPSVYEVWQDMRQGEAYTAAQADSAEQQYDAYYYFRMIIRSNPAEKQDADYFNYGIRRELFLIRQLDTIPCAICQHIINGNQSLDEYLLAFPREEMKAGNGRFKSNLRLLYTGSFLGLPVYTFEFTRTQLNKIPALKI